MLHNKNGQLQYFPNTHGFTLLEQDRDFPVQKGLVCLVKGLLMFFAAFGSIGGLLSSLDIAYQFLPVIFCLFFFSMALAFLHYNRLIFNIFYPIVFLIFTFFIWQNKWYVNSGYQYFVDALFEAYRKYFGLNITRQSSHFFEDSYGTITVAAIFIGFFIVILLNISISSYMSLFLTVLITFPILQFGLYIGKSPKPPYVVLLLVAYMTIGILGRTGHFSMPDKKSKGNFRLPKQVKIHGQAVVRHSYWVQGRALLHILVFSLLLSAVFAPFTYGLMGKTTSLPAKNGLKTFTDSYVKLYLQAGFGGLFDTYSATGGMSNGRLGGVGSVRSDYQADLVVTFAPYSTSSVYLRAFTGGNYTGNSWNPVDFNLSYAASLPESTDISDYNNFSAFLEARRLHFETETTPETSMQGNMEIQNTGAFSGYLYLPYYTEEISLPYTTYHGITTGSLSVGNSVEISYFPYLDGYWKAISGANDALLADYPTDSKESFFITTYEKNCTEKYLEVPENITPTLDSLMGEIGTSQDPDVQIALIKTYLNSHYTYTTSPGKTPANSDFAEYFLTTQHEGYCAHFATAATLLFRSCGIPARYVEGYVISPDLLADASYQETKSYDDYMKGNTPLGKTGVIQVEVPDANAHAWVEVYKKGFGWVPVEVTPPSDEEAIDTSSLLRIFSSIFSTSLPDSKESGTQADNAVAEKPSFSEVSGNFRLLYMPFIVIFLIILLLYPGTLFFSSLRETLYLRYHYLQGNYGNVISCYYRKLCRILYRKGMVSTEHPLPEQVGQLIFAPEQMDLLEKCCYSRDSVSRQEAHALVSFFRKTIRRYRRMRKERIK